MSYLELKVPPVLVFLLAFSGMLGLPTLCQPCLFDWLLLRVVAAFLAFMAMLLAVTALRAFRHHRTTVHPMAPLKASTLVNSGVFQISRNPMYLSLAIVLLALCVWLGDPVTLIGVVFFIAYMTRFQIIPEERALTHLFGDDYKRYCQQVRRWL